MASAHWLRHGTWMKPLRQEDASRRRRPRERSTGQRTRLVAISEDIPQNSCRQFQNLRILIITSESSCVEIFFGFGGQKKMKAAILFVLIVAFPAVPAIAHDP